MIVRTIVAIFVLSAMVAGPVSAQSGASVRVTASADPVEAAVGETVVFRVEVEGAPATVIQTPSRPSTVNLEPRRRAPRTERSRSTKGGELRRTVTFSWRFQPQETGTARIRPATIVVRGEEYTTEDIRVRVTPPPQRPSTPTLTHPEDASAPTLDERDLFVRATATADRAYQNEQVVVEYRLFYRPGVRLRHSRLADSWN
ncbi:MAG: protein BatD, partial [Bacteroidetes bacterium QH_1_64_81]